TTADYPPFNARDEDGVLVGINVDLARAICLELDVTCQVTSRPWEQLFPRLDSGDADAVIAAHRINVETLAKADFTRPYFYTPGRFVARRDGPALTISPRGLDRVRIGVAEGTAHEAFVQTFFRTSRVVRFKTPEAARAALSERTVDAIFGDGVSLTFWINGSLSGGCCDLAGGPYLEPIFFGDGIGVAVKRGNRALLTDLNDAIEALHANGRMLELLQRYFPRQIF
ncbi:MAG: transporter substrate-binding domain-containing protein, partial [Pseudomonadota bacterium]